QKFRVESSTVIEPGDMVYLDETVVRPASEIFWNEDLATSRADFADVFLGIAHERSANGDSAPVSVDVSAMSIYEFRVTSSTFTNGDILAPEEGDSDLLNQQLAHVASASQAVARAAEYAESVV